MDQLEIDGGRIIDRCMAASVEGGIEAAKALRNVSSRGCANRLYYALFAALHAFLPPLLEGLHLFLLGIGTCFHLLHTSTHGAVIAFDLLLVGVVAGRWWLGQSRFCSWYSTPPNG